MKKTLLLCALLTAATASSSFGAIINLSTVTFGNNAANAVTGINIGSSDPVTFSATFFSPLLCTGADAALCGGYVLGPLGDARRSSGAVETFNLGKSVGADLNPETGDETDSGLRYMTDGGAWTVLASGASGAIIDTFGFFYIEGDELNTTTAGRMSFSFPIVQGGESNLAVQGLSTPVPEPTSMVFVGTGLLGLGLLRRRVRKA